MKPAHADVEYRCHLAVSQDEDGQFSAVALNLPGAGSCGATAEEAIANAREAVTAVIESYLEEGKEVPWHSEYAIPPGATVSWILLNA